ncbi:roadblock/LC7 domain-containing protein [Streptomyces sp. ET3-23]|uniref:Roadblock/LC7 domain-containing protein n=2 Tax=Streptomyces TaxID=1883 RepID=A0A7Y7B2R8_STRMO|nr:MULTISPECIES: roadblock/LC7 domain-containing protein [Streptomyces]MCC2278198.1 roadblock/LC7 domain-containing protein [Streptomyces sp. ET3-23]NVK77862.1 roadblock/LC7 domain-containing protein [Streptomyces morookaense]
MRRALRQFAGRRQPMTAAPEVLSELQGLRVRVPHLTGALVASKDGLVIAHVVGDVEPDGLAALTAAALGVGARLTEAVGHGGFRELLVSGERGYVATYAAGTSCVLTLLASAEANVGRLNLEARRTGPRIAALVEGTLERQARP